MTRHGPRGSRVASPGAWSRADGGARDAPPPRGAKAWSRPRRYPHALRTMAISALAIALAAAGAGCRRGTSGQADGPAPAGQAATNASSGGPAPGAPSAAQARPDIVLVTIDTLRDDRVTPALTPAIAGVAGRGTRFTRAWTVAPLTLPAHVSLMTAVGPPTHGVRLNGVHRFAGAVPTLARVLRDAPGGAGYDTAAFVGAFVLDRRFGLDAGFAHYDDEVPRSAQAAARLEAERPAAIVVDRAIAWWTAAGREGPRPRFLWVHLYDPHAPYAAPASFARPGRSAYDAEVAYADAQVGRLLAAVEAPGRGDRTLVAIAGDHGESLGEHGEMTHGMLLYEGAVRVPIVIAGPGVPAGSRADPASLVDLGPTLLARAGIAAPAAWEGRDLLARAAVAPEAYMETIYPESLGWSALSAITDGEWKAIRSAGVELYDLRVDAAESRDQAAARPAMATAMQARLAALAARATPSATAAVTDEARERLRALGYVAAGAAPRPAAAGAAPNPAARIATWVALEGALSALAAGRTGEALATLSRLALDAPDAPIVQSTYARALGESGRARDALRVYRRAAARWPTDPVLLHDLAVAARAAGAADEARRAGEAAVALDPGYALAHHGLGLVRAEAGDLAGARAAFARAADLDPSYAPFQVDLGNALREAGEAGAAERAYRRALALDARSADALNGLGVLRVQADRPAEAVALLRDALAIDPGFVEARLNLGIAAQQAGDLATAREAWRAVLRAPAAHARERAAAADLLRGVR